MSVPFFGPHGKDWCVRPAQLGPPDTINETQLQWLIVPGPPISAYVAFVFPRADPSPMTFYHVHPTTWSMHVVLSGAGRHYAEGEGNDVGPGSVIYQGPGVRHSLHPLPNQHLMHVSIQHPSAGYVQKEWEVCPEAGTTEAFGDAEAFLRRFGTGEDLVATLKKEHIWSSERWTEYVAKRRAGGT